MPSLDFIWFKLEYNGSEGSNKLNIRLYGRVANWFNTKDNIFSGTIHDESFSDGFFIPDSVWDCLDEGQEVEGTFRIPIKYRCPDWNDYTKTTLSVKGTVKLQKGGSIKHSCGKGCRVPGHWAKITYRFDIKQGNPGLQKYIDYCGGRLCHDEYLMDDDETFEMRATFTANRFWTRGFSQSISTSHTASSAFQNKENISRNPKCRAIGYDKKTGNKSWGPWRDTRKEAEKDMETMKSEQGDLLFDFAVECEDNLLPKHKEPPKEEHKEPKHKKPPKEAHNRIYGKVTGLLGEPIQFATISFAGKQAVTDQTGKYELTDVFTSGEITATAPGYETFTDYIEPPTEGDMEYNITLKQTTSPTIDTTPLAQQLVPQQKEENEILRGIDDFFKGFLDPKIAKDAEPGIVTILRAEGLDDWADKYNDLINWLSDNFGVEIGGKKRIILAGFEAPLLRFAARGGLRAEAGVTKKVAGILEGALGGMSIKGVIKKVIGVVGTVIFAEFICEEAVQTAGMGVYIATQRKDPVVLENAIHNYEQVLNACEKIHNVIKIMDPIGATFEAFFDAAKSNLESYKEMLNKLRGKKLERGKTYNVYVKEVIDGDTIDVYLNNEKYRVRLWGINAPEKSTKEGKMARSYLKAWIEGKNVDINVVYYDVYGRNICKVSLAGTDINKLMVGEGMAYALEDEYRSLEYEARDEEKGIFKLFAEYLQIKQGYLKITSKPTGASIFIDGKPTNKITPEKIKLPEGTHTIRVSKMGYIDEEEDVDILEGETTEVRFELKKIEFGKVKVYSKPSYAEIWINDQNTGKLTPEEFELPEGKYTITCKYIGYEEGTKEVTVEKNKEIETKIYLKKL